MKLHLVSSCVLFSLVIYTCVSGQCLEDQKSLLHQLKHNFSFWSPVSLSSWDLETDCCSFWEGISCDRYGHVTGLDLNSQSIFYVAEWSSLLELKHLTSLNLSHNSFRAATIPSGLDRLANLKYLNLSYSSFGGQIPVDISRMERLVSLDLSSSLDVRLRLENPDLRTLVRNLSDLRELHLDGVNISMHGIEWSQALSSALPHLQVLSLSSCFLSGPPHSSLLKLRSLSTLRLNENNISAPVPDFLGNFSNLSFIHLSHCNLLGNFPEQIFQLRLLQSFNVSSNSLLQGFLPEFPLNLSLQLLDLSYTSLSGELPQSIGNLRSLNTLSFTNCSFNGSIPSSMSNLTKLEYLDLSFNKFTGTVPNFGSSVNLTRIDLSHNQLTGTIPSSLFNGSSSVLRYLDLSDNMFQGPLPLSVFEISSLQELDLSYNSWNGTAQLHKFQNIRNLSFLKLGVLKLVSCNLTTFPDFLRNQQSSLWYLDLSMNQIRGKIPNWIGEIGKGGLIHLNLSSNMLENPNQVIDGSLFRSLEYLDLHSNSFQGPIPILPPSVVFLDYSHNKFTTIIPNDIGLYIKQSYFFSLSHNKFSGEIPSSICNAKYLQMLDLSNNDLSGHIPQCLSEAQSLLVLKLRSNQLHGAISNTFPSVCSLRTLDLNGNKIHGEIPNSLANCSDLGVLDLGNNSITGSFPSWLGESSKLWILILGSNKLHGPIKYPRSNNTFPLLHIIDLSSNRFTGPLPSEMFMRWKAMMIKTQPEYEEKILIYQLEAFTDVYYQDSVIVENKGQNMELVKIFVEFASIDLSNNQFHGEIPQVIGNLTSLHVLNLSHNALTGPIPSSFGNLKALESLDLSTNKLNGRIPTELADLTFLSVLNLSFNQLVGRIPEGHQLPTFPEDVFKGNGGLCGPPTSKSCVSNTFTPTITSRSKQCKFSLFKNCPEDGTRNWQLISATLGYGVGIGIAISVVVFWRRCNELCVTISKWILKME